MAGKLGRNPFEASPKKRPEAEPQKRAPAATRAEPTSEHEQDGLLISALGWFTGSVVLGLKAYFFTKALWREVRSA